MTSDRIEPPAYFMGIALAVRRRADCLGNRVGAIVVRDRRIISTGYNGTPSNMPNCTEGGCHRCSNRDRYPPGTGYDLCICVHAEQNALLAAARFGIAVEGATIYSTMRPCFGCAKEMLQARIVEVYFLHDWTHPDPDPEKQTQYALVQGRFRGGIRRLDVPDPDADWAVSKRREPGRGRTDELGHVSS
jgi:dCMP deaminase